MSNTGCGDKWDREPKRRAMQNGIRAKDRVMFQEEWRQNISPS